MAMINTITPAIIIEPEIKLSLLIKAPRIPETRKNNTPKYNNTRAQFNRFNCLIFISIISVYFPLFEFSRVISLFKLIKRLDVDRINNPIPGKTVIGKYHCSISVFILLIRHNLLRKVYAYHD